MEEDPVVRALRAFVADAMARLTANCSLLTSMRDSVEKLEAQVTNGHQIVLLAAELLAQLTDGKEGQDIIDGWQEVP